MPLIFLSWLKNFTCIVARYKCTILLLAHISNVSTSFWHLILSSVILADSPNFASSMNLTNIHPFHELTQLTRMLNRIHPNPSTCRSTSIVSKGGHHSIYNPVLLFIRRAMALNWNESDVTSPGVGYMRWLW